ncbi:MAG: PEP-CTERM sorting domain-containing protein [Planctomycetia bacterium]|nr:PEP-CTERM sorting domain-containing protein [Planctomycetia bacterium]
MLLLVAGIGWGGLGTEKGWGEINTTITDEAYNYQGTETWDISVKSGGTLNVAPYFRSGNDVNPGDGTTLFLAGPGLEGVKQPYIDTGTNYDYDGGNQLDYGALLARVEPNNGNTIHPDVVIDTTLGASITLLTAAGATPSKMILKGSLTGGALKTFGGSKDTVIAADGAVNLQKLQVATGIFQFNSTETAITSATHYVQEGILVEKGATLSLNKYKTWQLLTSETSDQLATITLENATLKTLTPGGSWTLKTNLTIQGDSQIDYSQQACALLFSGGVVHGEEGASLTLSNITGGGLVLQDGASLTGDLEFCGAYKLRFDSGTLLKGNLTVSGGQLHFNNTNSTTAGMTSQSSITMKGGTLQVDNGLLQGTVTIQGSGNFTGNANLTVQNGTLKLLDKNSFERMLTFSTQSQLEVENSSVAGTWNFDGGNLTLQSGVTNSGALAIALKQDTVLTLSAGTGTSQEWLKMTRTTFQGTYALTVQDIAKSNNHVMEVLRMDVKGIDFQNAGEVYWEIGDGTTGTLTLSESGVTKSGTGTVHFHLKPNMTVDVAAGVSSATIGSGLNFRIKGATTFDVGQNQILTVDSAIVNSSQTGDKSLTKTGTGTLILNGNNTYAYNGTGGLAGTTVKEGRLLVSRQLGDDLRVEAEGILSAGDDIGKIGSFTITNGNLTILGTLEIDAYEGSHDRILLTNGDVFFAEGAFLDLYLTDIAESLQQGMLVMEAGGITSVDGWDTIVSDSQWMAYTASLDNGKVGLFLAARAAVPEPATWGMFLIGLGWLGCRVVRRWK